jgi:hypothetical protein
MKSETTFPVVPPFVVFCYALIFTVSFFFSFDLPDLAREIEAVISLGAGLLFTAAIVYFARLTASTEDPLTAMARQARERGAGDVDARTLELVHTARLKTDKMVHISQGRVEAFRQAVKNFAEVMECLYDDILTSPEIRRRADNLIRRTLPRLAEAVETYVEYAERGTDLVDPTEMRARVIEALTNASEQAERVRIDAIEGVESNVEVALDVLESSFAYERR